MISSSGVFPAAVSYMALLLAFHAHMQGPTAGQPGCVFDEDPGYLACKPPPPTPSPKQHHTMLHVGAPPPYTYSECNYAANMAPHATPPKPPLAPCASRVPLPVNPGVCSTRFPGFLSCKPPPLHPALHFDTFKTTIASWPM